MGKWVLRFGASMPGSTHFPVMFVDPLHLKAVLPEGAGLCVGRVGSPAGRAAHWMRARVASRSGSNWQDGFGLLLAAGAHRAMMFLVVVLTAEGAADCLGPTDLEGMAPAPAPHAQGGPGMASPSTMQQVYLPN
jgi:hypothetical protein